MTIRRVFALFSLLSLWLLATACTAETAPAAEATAVPPTITESTASPTDAPLPTPTIEPTAELEATEVPTDDLTTFMTAVQAALAERDFDRLVSLMSDPFAFGNYRSEWQQFAPADLRPLLENWLPAGAAVQFSPEDTDLSAMLDGQPAQTMLGPDVPVVAAWHSTGWGAEGDDEVILFVVEEGDGRFALKAMLYAPYGFLLELNDLPVQDEQPAPVGLLYASADGGIWQIGVDGQPQQLTAQPDAVPAPDGRHAFYAADDNLWLIDLASDERTQLTSTADGVYLAGSEQWADNETILAGVWLDLETEGGPNMGRPALIDIASGALTLLDEPDHLLMRGYPAVSATGSVAFDHGGRSADDRDFNWTYQPETGTMLFEAGDFVNAVENAGYTAPAWSADGRFLAWLTFTGENVNHLAVFDLESSTVANLPSYQGVGFGGPYPNPVIGPDPNWIALRQLTADPDLTGLWLYTQDGQEPVFIAHNGGESLWLNDHVLLFIDYEENYNAQLQQYDALTGIRSAITLPDVAEIFGIVE